MKAILSPKKNKKDLVEMPARVRRDMRFVFVERMEEALPVALSDKATAKPKKRGVKILRR